MTANATPLPPLYDVDRTTRQLTISRTLLDVACDEIADVAANIKEYDKKLGDRLQDALYLLYIVHEEIVELRA